MPALKVELLYFDGCPSFGELRPRLAALLARRGLGAALELHRIDSAAAASSARFLGSPSVRVNGADVEPGAQARSDFGLKCRIYQLGGGLARTPPDELIEAALDGASS